MRWKSLLGALALLLAAFSGCKQKAFMTAAQFNRYKELVPANLESNPNVDAQPTIPPCHAPPSMWDLDRKIRYLSLAEAVSIALEQGTVGQPSLLFPGISLDNPVVFAGRGTSGDDNIRVLALDPATVGAGIDASLSKFDAVWVSSMTWTTTDQPIATSLQTFQAGASGLNAINQEQATFSSGVLKPLPTGGVAGITFNVPYTYTNLPARQNPAYQPLLQFQFEQPLLQGYGVEINQLRSAHPGSVLTPGLFNNAPTPEGILITRIRFNQQRAEFERNLNQMLLNVETAYWNLYGSYWALYSREQGLRFAYEAWKIVSTRYNAGRENLANYAQTLGQYELFRSQRLTAIDTVLDNERQLRGLMGLQIEDGTRLVPSDSPTLAEYRPNWDVALAEALSHRPELYMARQDIKANQYNVILAKNLLLPDLRLTSTYDTNSLGGRLDGPGNQNALRNLVLNHFNDWALGLRLNVPIGFRAANSNLRQAQLQLARAYLVLQDQELKIERYLGLQYRRMSSTYVQIKAQRAQREAFGIQLRTRYQEYVAGRGTLDILLEAQRFWADALANEYSAIVGYQNALCAFEYAKGTILNHDNITIAEGAVPAGIQMRAVEHERERTRALILAERARPVPALAQPMQPAGVINFIPQNSAASLPVLWKDAPPLKEAGELPAPPEDPGQPVPQATGPVQVAPGDVFPPALLGPEAGQQHPASTTPPMDLPPGAPINLPPLPPTSGSTSETSVPQMPGKPSTFGAIRPVSATPSASPLSAGQPLLPLPRDPLGTK
jgi:outer membrane protein TolC